VDAGRTRRGAVRNGREALAKVGARVLGVTLNRMSEAMSGDYYYYDYYGGYGTDAARDKGEGKKAVPAVAPPDIEGKRM
jgi:Mrp family chromosome partitioning ATPase